MGGWAGRRAERRRHSSGRFQPDEHRSLPRTPATPLHRRGHPFPGLFPRCGPSLGRRCHHPRLARGVPPREAKAGKAVSAASIQDGDTSVATTRNTCSVLRFDPPLGSHWTFASHRRNPQRGGPALRRRRYLPAPGPSPPAEEGPGSAQPAQFTPHPARTTRCGRRMAAGARMPGARGPFAPLIGGPTPWGRAYTSIGP